MQITLDFQHYSLLSSATHRISASQKGLHHVISHNSMSTSFIGSSNRRTVNFKKEKKKKKTEGKLLLSLKPFFFPSLDPLYNQVTCKCVLNLSEFSIAMLQFQRQQKKQPGIFAISCKFDVRNHNLHLVLLCIFLFVKLIR